MLGFYFTPRWGSRAAAPIVLLLFSVACSQLPGPTAGPDGPEKDLERGEQALAQGDAARALQILQYIPEDDPHSELAGELILIARAEMEALTKEWLSEIDVLIKEGRLRTAKGRAEMLLDEFPLDGAKRADVEERLEKIKSRRDEVTEEIKQTEEDAREALRNDNLSSALRSLRRLFPAVRDTDEERALEWEKLLAIAQWRLVQKKHSTAIAYSRKQAERKRSKLKRLKARQATAKNKGNGDPSEALRDLTPHEQAVSDMLRRADRARQRKAYFDAISLYVQVTREDKNNATALGALKSLAKKRQELVDDLLNTANRYFQRQDLARAAPYYERVLQLDPTNKRALEGMRMFENLERIRQERGN